MRGYKFVEFSKDTEIRIQGELIKVKEELGRFEIKFNCR